MGTTKDSWHSSEPTLREALKKAAESAVSDQCDNEEIKNILKSAAERQLEYALRKFNNINFSKVLNKMTQRFDHFLLFLNLPIHLNILLFYRTGRNR